MSLMDRVLKNNTLKAKVLTDSSIFKEPEYTTTPVPVLNYALSGKFYGGLKGGITTIAGPSRHFKSTLALIMAKSYLDQHKDAIIFFYDNERGMTADYFEAVGIDPQRVVYMKIHHIEELKHDLMKQLSENIKDGDKAFFLIDSVGNLASIKEVEDAKDGKIVVDMTRAKAFKSLYRMITPYITDFDIPFVQIAHVYAELGLFPKIVVSGGTGIMLSSDTIILIGRAKETDSQRNLLGYTFKLKIEKSRYAIEGSVFDLEVTFEGGIRKFGGLLKMAEDSGYVTKPKKGRYARVCVPEDLARTPEGYMKKATYAADFWTPIIENTDFIEVMDHKFSLAVTNLLNDGLTDES